LLYRDCGCGQEAVVEQHEKAGESIIAGEASLLYSGCKFVEAENFEVFL